MTGTTTTLKGDFVGRAPRQDAATRTNAARVRADAATALLGEIDELLAERGAA